LADVCEQLQFLRCARRLRHQKVVIAILGPPRRADLKARVWPILRDARLNPIAILLLGDIQTTLAELLCTAVGEAAYLGSFPGSS
jgi:hypothetical protein